MLLAGIHLIEGALLILGSLALGVIGAIMDAKMFAALVSGSIVFYLYMKRSYFHVK